MTTQKYDTVAYTSMDHGTREDYERLVAILVPGGHER